MIISTAAALAGGALLLRRLRRPGNGELASAVVVITGGSRGLGLMLAREFGQRGARLAICARDEAGVGRAHDDLIGRGYEVLARSCDVRKRDDVENFIAAVVERYGRIDILVNNAGTIEVGPASVMTEDDYADALQTHFWGAYYAVEAALPALREAPHGRIVNIVSIGGLVAVPHLLPYTVSKFAALGYSLGLREELAHKGVSVTTICPGLMRTGSPRNAWFKGRNQAEYGWFSLGSALPLTSVSAHSAARRVVTAALGDEELVVLSLPAQILATLQHLLPSLTVRALSLVARLLPSEGGIGTSAARGYESESRVSESVLTTLSKRAEDDLLQR
ncbi:MAG: SDR family oxidoreductase [Candidatus Eremiobacteraeota bacterium]|nr:SDR family oxidoreductase [Candidatus Eremiobacteraeota bacterium]